MCVLDSRVDGINRDIKTIGMKWRLCLCGCGKAIQSIDSHGRARYYVAGHNRRHKRKDRLSIEIDKIQTLEQAKDIIYTQAQIILELQQRNVS
jgi:hypothetical protein